MNTCRGADAIVVRMITVPLLMLAFSAAQGENYPQRPVKMIVPFAAGGVTDSVGRVVAHYLGERLGQQVVVENRGGGGGTVGSEAAARSTPDGYTLLFGSAESFGLTYPDAKRLNYDPEKDLTPVAMIARAPNVFVVHPTVKAATIKELVELARANPGKLRYGSPGVGSNGHIIGEMFKDRFHIDMIHVPYKGGGAGINDVVSGQIELLIAGSATAAPRIRSGQVRGLAVTGAARLPIIPNVPTMDEAGVSDFVLGPLFCVFAPAGTPPEVIARLEREIVALVGSPEFKQRLIDLGAEEVEPLTGAAFGHYIRAEVQRWREMAVPAGFKKE
jgi:tripartite-type tricarboxylate transporter receptor subunit TctC